MKTHSWLALVGLGLLLAVTAADAQGQGKTRRFTVVVKHADAKELAATLAKHFKDAQKFSDYRKMFDEIGKNIDAVTVSTPGS